MNRDPATRRPPSLATHLLGAFGATTALAFGVCAVLLVLLDQVGDDVAAVRRDEQLAHQALELGVAVREQYIHEAHTIIEATRSHLGHHRDWVGRVRRETRSLHASVPAGERWRLDRIAETSAALECVFEIDIVPAMERGDREAVRSAHHTADLLVGRAATDVDALSRALEARMADTHARTLRLTSVALATTGLSLLLLLGVAALTVVRLRKIVLGPLGTLAAAARRVGAGDLATRVDTEAGGEIREVADAFNRMAEELRTREARLVASERMAAIGQLAAGVAHEVNNPIGIIRGYLRTMIPDAHDDEQRGELEILDEEARSCQRIVEDLTAFARAPELDRRPVALGALVRETAHRLESSGELAGSRVAIDADEGLVEADEARLRQVVANLLRNAAQASAPQTELSVTGRAGPDGYTLTFADRGAGIAPEDLPRIFEPFWSKRRGGTGLGLAVCEGIVRAHGGRIGARARGGGGTEIVVELPRERASSGAPTGEPS